MTINCKGKLLDLGAPKVMGILNLTPDSFFDGGSYMDGNSVLHRVESMLVQGADIIDLGAYSSRPGADGVSEADELKRLIPMLDLILDRFPQAIISIDTFRSVVARESVAHGAAMINDIAAGNLDPMMIPVVAELQVPYIMMHMKGDPKTMQGEVQYGDLVKDIHYYFSQKIQEAVSHKIKDIILDPGFGFSKTLEQNYFLLNHLELFRTFGLPLLIGLSRKSMIYKLLGTSPKEALNGTTALHAIALLKGANIIRAHDVREAVECVKLVEVLKVGAS